MADFDLAVEPLLKNEGGGYVPNDHGRGPSKWGITLLTAADVHPSWGPSDIQNLTQDDAKEFYREWAWQDARIGLIDNQELATKLLDLGVNVGLGTAIKFLQQAIGVTVDGRLGAQTAMAANSQDPNTVIEGLMLAGKAHYDRIVLNDPSQQVNYNGWIARLDRRFPA